MSLGRHLNSPYLTSSCTHQFSDAAPNWQLIQGVIPQTVRGRTEMWGWKSIERFVPTDVGVDSARVVLSEKGYEILQETDGALFTEKSGTQFTVQGQEMSVEIAVAAESNGLFLQARYASFVLFDTGDLQSHLNDIVNEIEQAVG